MLNSLLVHVKVFTIGLFRALQDRWNHFLLPKLSLLDRNLAYESGTWFYLRRLDSNKLVIRRCVRLLLSMRVRPIMVCKHPGASPSSLRLNHFTLGVLHRPIRQISRRRINRLLSDLLIFIHDKSVVKWDRLAFLTVVLLRLRCRFLSTDEFCTATLSTCLDLLRASRLIGIGNCVAFLLEILALWSLLWTLLLKQFLLVISVHGVVLVVTRALVLGRHQSDIVAIYTTSIVLRRMSSWVMWVICRWHYDLWSYQMFLVIRSFGCILLAWYEFSITWLAVSLLGKIAIDSVVVLECKLDYTFMWRGL